MLDPAGVRQVCGVGHTQGRVVGEVDGVGDVGGGGDQRDVELAVQPFADDLHVQQAQEARAEAEPEGDGRLGFEAEARVVQPQLVERLPKVREVAGVHRVQAAEHHRGRLAVARQGRGGRELAAQRDRVADLGFADALDGGGQVADLAGAQLIDRDRLG